MRNTDNFFVGYLPTPQPLVLFYRFFIPLIILVILALGLWIALGQKSPGKTQATFGEVEMTGYLTVDPYPVVHQVGEERLSVLVVEQSKKSANEALAAFANQWVTLSGFTLQRGHWHMLLIGPDAQVHTPTRPQRQPALQARVLGEVSLEGEIVDSKCYLGAMKPGGGKVHRACASLCLLGGIPPMLVVKSPGGDRYGYVLKNADGGSAAIALADLVAIPVRASGTLVQQGDIQYLQLDPANIQKLVGRALSDYGETLADGKASALATAMHHQHRHH